MKRVGNFLELYDVFGDRWYINVNEIQSMRFDERDTKIFFSGSSEDYIKVKGDMDEIMRLIVGE